MLQLKPTNWDAVGCSYKYNTGYWDYRDRTRVPMEDPGDGIAGKDLNWVSNPSLYILMHEPPARAYFGWFVHWHYARGTTDVPQSRLMRDTQRFISPVLFVDAHAAKHDFTKAIQSDPDDPFEPTKDWIWYKPAQQPRSNH